MKYFYNSSQGEEWYHLRSKLTGGITSRKLLWSFLPTLNVICDDFIELIRHKRDENGVVHNFQDMANLMGLESKYFYEHAIRRLPP